MPFVSKEHRAKPDPRIAGDRCFVHYKQMIDMWTTSPRWTTVDQILESPVLGFSEDERAFFLAFLQFYVEKVVDYERKKKLENGDI